MHQAAIYVRAPLVNHPSIISKENQETICRDYCASRDLSVAATFTDDAGSRDQFARMMNLATSLEDSIKHRDKLMRTSTKLFSATERRAEKQNPKTDRP